MSLLHWSPFNQKIQKAPQSKGSSSSTLHGTQAPLKCGVISLIAHSALQYITGITLWPIYTLFSQALLHGTSSRNPAWFFNMRPFTKCCLAKDLCCSSAPWGHPMAGILFHYALVHPWLPGARGRQIQVNRQCPTGCWQEWVLRLSPRGPWSRKPSAQSTVPERD